MSDQKRDLIYLTGFMASGKSTIAPILANTLGFEQLDIDAEISDVTGHSISEIFEERGEQYFRSVERSILQAASRRRACIVSLGGGTIANAENFRIIKSTGILVYLKADPEQIFQRVRHKTDRPLLRAPDGVSLTEDDLRARIARLLELREPFYSQADITIRTDEHRVAITVDELVRAVRPFIP